MNKNIILILLAMIIINISCSGAPKKNDSKISISDINTDFSNSETLKLSHFRDYMNIYGGITCFDDSVIWANSGSTYNIGYCYDLNTGKKLSTIADIGKAAYEFTRHPNLYYDNDYIHAYYESGSKHYIKSFSKKDIIENKPMNERNFSVVTVPDSICVFRATKLPNGSILVNIEPTKYSPLFYRKYKFNTNSVAVINSEEANSYETIDYKSFNSEKDESTEKFNLDEVVENAKLCDKIKMSYAQGEFCAKGSEIVAFTMYNQFILYTFDINTGKVLNEKRYTEALDDEIPSSFMTINSMKQKITKIKANDKHIVCLVKGFFSEKDKVAKIYKEAIFVFDWDLNPIKRFNLPDSPSLPHDESIKNIISADGKTLYQCHYHSEGITVSKASLEV